MITYTKEIYHHGIEGQKWGVQNGPPYPLDQDDKSAAEKRAEGGGKNSWGGAHGGKAMSDMSDKELQDYVNRLNMEQQYSNLTRVPDANLERIKRVNTWMKEVASFTTSTKQILEFARPIAQHFFGKKKSESSD